MCSLRQGHSRQIGATLETSLPPRSMATSRAQAPPRLAAYPGSILHTNSESHAVFCCRFYSASWPGMFRSLFLTLVPLTLRRSQGQFSAACPCFPSETDSPCDKMYGCGLIRHLLQGLHFAGPLLSYTLSASAMGRYPTRLPDNQGAPTPLRSVRICVQTHTPHSS